MNITVNKARMLANCEQLGLSLTIDGETIEYIFDIHSNEDSEIQNYIRTLLSENELNYERPSEESVYEYKAFEIRDKRDMLLSETDKYFTISDMPAKKNEDLESLKEYRQALRDIPQQEGFPENVVWPDKPACIRK